MSCQIKFHVVDQFLCQNNPLGLVMTGCFAFLKPCVWEWYIFENFNFESHNFSYPVKGWEEDDKSEWVFGFCQNDRCIFRSTICILTSKPGPHLQSKMKRHSWPIDPGQLRVDIWQIATWNILTRASCQAGGGGAPWQTGHQVMLLSEGKFCPPKMAPYPDRCSVCNLSWWGRFLRRAAQVRGRVRALEVLDIGDCPLRGRPLSN